MAHWANSKRLPASFCTSFRYFTKKNANINAEAPKRMYLSLTYTKLFLLLMLKHSDLHSLDLVGHRGYLSSVLYWDCV